MTKGIPFACGNVCNGLTHAQLTTLLQWIHSLPQLDDEAQLLRYLDTLAEESKASTLQILHGQAASQGWLGTPRRLCAGTVPLLQHHSQHPLGLGMGSEVQFYAAENGESTACLSLHSNGHLTQLHVDSTLPGAELRMLGSLLPHLHRTMQRISPASSGDNPLSHRERDIFYWMMHGKTNWEIATILDISERTVKFHAANIIRKLDANNRIHAIVLGLQKGLAA
ncbi:LuxR C-terminal-related transcriptional regulator [Vogesella amnigena]|uniref:LuxR C-terminal-related transcriptional regulator n=1 Tax=Vogesella amnigena TaxID=1507449 RepID=A0ABV7TN77_9NEIS